MTEEIVGFWTVSFHFLNPDLTRGFRPLPVFFFF